MITIVKEEQTRPAGGGSSVSTYGAAYDWWTSDGGRFWASEAYAMFTGQEILVFAYEGNDDINWSEVAGGRGITWTDAKADLLAYLNAKEGTDG